MMICNNCGNEIQPGSAFCIVCGTPMGASQGDPTGQPDQAARQDWNGYDGSSNPGQSGYAASFDPWQNGYAAGGQVHCFHCGALLSQGDVFCPNCGAPTPYSQGMNGDMTRRQKNTNTSGGGTDHGSGKGLIIVLSILAGLLILLLAGMMIWHFSAVKDEPFTSSSTSTEESALESDADAEDDSGEDEEAVQEDADQADAADSGEDGVVSDSAADAAGEDTAPAVAYDASGEAEEAVIRYLDAYINDINMGSYSALYSAVSPGSKMESTQKSFIAKSHLTENLLGYDIQAIEKKDSSTYHVTAVERYDVFDHDKNDAYYVKQRCVYRVIQQPDGTWMVSDFVGGVKVLEKS